MRVIFENVEGQYFLEIILGWKDVKSLESRGELQSDFFWEENEIADLNIFIRKEK